MRFTFFLFFGLLLCIASRGQTPYLLDVVMVTEEVPIPPAIAAEIQAQIGFPPKTYRLYAETDLTTMLISVNGREASPLFLNAGNTFYQHPEGGPTPSSIPPIALQFFPSLAFDSWLTIGYENSIGAGTFFNPSADVYAEWEQGQNLYVGNIFDAIFVFPDSNNPVIITDENNRILVGQFTVGKPVSGCMNMIFRNPFGTGNEILPDGLQTNLYENVFCFDSFEMPCLGDLDANGTIQAADMLLFLTGFGCEGFCNADLNGDGLVNTADLLQLLSVFGTPCP